MGIYISSKENLTVTRGEVGGDNGEKRGRKGCQGTLIKDTQTKPKGARIEGGSGGWLGWGEWRGENKKPLDKL